MSNPYLKQSHDILNSIMLARGIHLPPDQIAEGLFLYDTVVCPMDKKKLLSKVTLTSLRFTTRLTILTFGIYQHLAYTSKQCTYSDAQLAQYTVFRILINRQQHSKIFEYYPRNRADSTVVKDVALEMNPEFAAYNNLLSVDRLYDMIVANKLALSSLDRTISSRVAIWINHPNVKFVYLLYRQNPLNANLYSLPSLGTHPLERIIYYTTLENLDAMISHMKVMIPLHTADRYDYFLTTISQYRNVTLNEDLSPRAPDLSLSLAHLNAEQRLTQLEKLSDYDACLMCDAYIPFVNRNALLTSLSNMYQIPRFHAPLTRRSLTQRETISGTPLTDSNTFMIAYGTPHDRFIYELQDLIGAFYLDSVSGGCAFRRPEIPQSSFTVSDIRGLIGLVKSYGVTQAFDQLLDTVERGLNYLQEKHKYDQELRHEVVRLSMADQTHFIDYLYTLFYLGMYMRRWLGPGHAYPLLERHSLIKMDPDHIVLDKRYEMRSKLESYSDHLNSVIRRVKLVEYSSSDIRGTNVTAS